MYLVAIAWGYVVLMMAVVEATSSTGTILGALVTALLYGALPISIVMYLLGTGTRRRKRLAMEAPTGASASTQPDGSGHATGDPVTPERKES